MIRLISESEASDEVKSVFDEVKRHYDLDFVPNAFKAMAHHPPALKQQWEYLKQSEETWGMETVHLVGWSVAATKSCNY